MATTTKTTVRERLSAIGAHLNTLRNQAAVIVAAEDPVAAAGKLAKIAGEMSAAQLIESQLSASLSESDVIAERDRLADLAAKAAATRPRETASFLAVVKATLELEGALNDMASVQYELASGGAGSFTTSVSDLVHAISATRVMWSFSNLGRSGLGPPRLLSDEERARAEAAGNLERCNDLLAAAKAFKRDAYSGASNDRDKLVKMYEKSRKRILRDIAVLDGREWYAIPENDDPEGYVVAENKNAEDKDDV